MASWTETAGGIASLVQAAAIFIGGIWAYFKFVRGRTFAPRCEIDLDAALLVSGERQALKVRATVRNTGSAANVAFKDEGKWLYLFGAPAAEWLPSVTIDWGKPLSLTPVFAQHAWIESQETIADEAVIPVDAFEASETPHIGAYRVQCRLVGELGWWHWWSRLRRRTVEWSADTIVLLGFQTRATPQ